MSALLGGLLMCRCGVSFFVELQPVTVNVFVL